MKKSSLVHSLALPLAACVLIQANVFAASQASVPAQAASPDLQAAAPAPTAAPAADSTPAPLPNGQAQDAAPEAEGSPWLSLPNCRSGRLERYAAWAEQHPDAAPETVVLQVNMDLDLPAYQDVGIVEDPASLTVLVNKHRALPEDYVPELEALGSRYGSGSLRPEAAQAFRAMADAAREEGIKLKSVSSYRSYSHQKSTYNRYLKQYKRKTVDTFSARPGHSEHQTGLALDINVASSKAKFEKTPAFAWLQENCAEYGFILRYPKDKTDITGYRFEPWHYRYVGVETARACMDQGLTYEEYLALLPEVGEDTPV